MLKIDTHNHILPKHIPNFKDRFGHGGFIQLEHISEEKARMVRDDGVFFRDVERNCWNPQARMEDMDRFRVDVQVLSTVPIMFSYGIPPQEAAQVHRFLNEDLANTVSQNPKRFVGLCVVPLQDSEMAARELTYCVKELGLAGAQIGSHVGKVNLSDEELFPFFEEAEKLNAALLVHPWDMMGRETMNKYWLPWLVAMPAETSRAICSMIFGGVFQRFPKLRVLFAHGGGSFPATIGRIEHGYNVRPDLCAIHVDRPPRDFLKSFYIDSITHDPKALHYILDLMGEGQVALGTDYPFPLGELNPGQLIESMSTLSQKTKNRLLGGTALEWLGLDGRQFERS